MSSNGVIRFIEVTGIHESILSVQSHLDEVTGINNSTLSNFEVPVERIDTVDGSTQTMYDKWLLGARVEAMIAENKS